MKQTEPLTTFGEGLLHSLDERMQFLGQNIADTHQFMHRCNRNQKNMGRKLRANLHAFVENLSGNVENLRHQFQQAQKARHRACLGAQQAWQKTVKMMATKRDHFMGYNK